MASLYSHAAFIICIAITIAHALAATDDKIFEATSIKRVGSNDIDLQVALKNLTKLTMDQISKVAPDFACNGSIERLINNTNPNNGLALSALISCRELLHLAMDNLNKSLSTDVTTVEGRGNIKSWVCAAGTTLQTCIDGFDDQAPVVRKLVFEKLKTPTFLNTDSTKFMALLDTSTLSGVHSSAIDPLGQNLTARGRDSYPRWLSYNDRKLLRNSKISANAVVANDGSGNYRRISDAIRAAPSLSKNRFVIYVKSGIYHENVKVGIDKWNVMMYGDGMDKTIIYSNRSHGGGVNTWDSATFCKLFVILYACEIKNINSMLALNIIF